ncbi:MAG: hypothetical protein AB2L24_24025 [Mangrovibacterium sp.]
MFGKSIKDKRHVNKKKIQTIYDEFLVFRLTIRDYCANQYMMNEARFFYWQNKLKGQFPSKSGFLPLVFGNGQQVSQLQVPKRNLVGTFPNPAVANPKISCEINYQTECG